VALVESEIAAKDEELGVAREHAEALLHQKVRVRVRVTTSEG